MGTAAKQIDPIDLDQSTLSAIAELCRETRMKPARAIQEAITAYRRQRANEKYLGAATLDLSEDHPSEIKRDVKKALKKKHGYSA
jgi:hypothetical protein